MHPSNTNRRHLAQDPILRPLTSLLTLKQLFPPYPNLYKRPPTTTSSSSSHCVGVRHVTLITPRMHDVTTSRSFGSRLSCWREKRTAFERATAITHSVRFFKSRWPQGREVDPQARKRRLLRYATCCNMCRDCLVSPLRCRYIWHSMYLDCRTPI